ncbi:MAG: hypothetical protein PUK40_00315 [Actinomycetaceae bacterium]|nr:hypothetical protein [Arcanobacterium sp.]MDD7504384.1 hypothetical protein [Actinomycetaceae bacterium]MDY6143048.1 hypothetical protein [Arcanobacterium sp.]
MVRVVACYKWVLDDVDIRVSADGSVDTSRAKGKISEYEKGAIQAAVQLAGDFDATPVGLTFGGDDAQSSLKDALSRGLDEAYWAHGDTSSADGSLTASVLAKAIGTIDDVSLVVCAEGSADDFARQTGPRLAAELDYPCISSVLEASVNGTTLTAKRRVDNTVETVEVELPAVIAVRPEFAEAPIPGIKAVMAARKKPTTEIDVAGLEAGSPAATVTATKGAVVERKGIEIKEDSPEATAHALVVALQKEGVL